MAINKEELLKCRGEDGAKPLNEILAHIVDESNLHDNKTQHMSGDENGTHFINGVYANGNELVADDDYKDPSAIQVSNLESEEKNGNSYK